jgi:hypothetical protein
MPTVPVVFPPPPWLNQDLVLYHGTIDSFSAAVVAGVQVGSGRPFVDFGPGFYTTTVYRQAYTWAAQIAATTPSGRTPAVVQITVSRNALAGLETLSFVRGDFFADDYWSFVHHCRSGALDHGRPGVQRCYDVVYGPVAAFWNQRMTITDADQISFHTSTAEDILNRSLRKRII